MVSLIFKLFRVGLLTPIGLVRLVEALLTTGINLMALLRIAAQLHPDRTAIVDDRDRLTYRQLWHQAEALAVALQQDYGLQPRQKVAIACRNHTAAVKAIFAISRLGAHLFLFNPDMSRDQLQSLIGHLAIDFYIYDHPDDNAVAPWLQTLVQQHKALPAYHAAAPSVDRLSLPAHCSNRRLKTVKTGNIVVMTGGTTGTPKPASRKPSILNFLPPFIALLEHITLDRYRSLFIATPIYHGFGLAALLIGVVLGAKLHVTRRFEAKQVCSLIAGDRIEVITLVPLMLQRLLQHDPTALSSLQRILTGGASLSPTLAQTTLEQLGPVLFNLYGTSEAGFCILGSPALLHRKPTSIGQPIWGVRAQIVNDLNQPVPQGSIGRLCIRSAWATHQTRWIETGDLAYRDLEGDIFLCGRVDDMIVSGGENVYPVELEHILLKHPDIETAVVVGISDAEFGQRLKAIAILKKDASLTSEDLRIWLKPQVARYQMPAVIEFRESLPYTALGKPDKKALRDW